MRETFDYVIYHRNCLDGFSSLLVAYMGGLFDSRRIWFHTIAPNDTRPPPHLSGTNRVLIMDVNMQASTVSAIVNNASKVLMVDHHPNKDHERIRRLEGPKFTYIHDQSESACSLMWKRIVFPDRPMPRFLEFIKDNDRATWKLKDTQSFILGFESKFNVHLGLSRELTFKKLDLWKTVIEDDAMVDKLIRQGKIIRPFQTRVLEQSDTNFEIVELSRPGHTTKLRAIITNGCVYLAKKLAAHLARKNEDKADLAIVWYYNSSEQNIQCIVRTTGADILWLLEMYGAGGHHKAGTFFYNAKHIYQWLQEHETRVARRNH